MTKLAPLALLALLAACGKPATTDTAPKPAAETGYIAKVQALPPGQREGVLFGAIQKGGGQACQGVKQVETMPATKTGQPVWRVTCDEGSQWSIALADDGTALVTGARDMGR